MWKGLRTALQADTPQDIGDKIQTVRMELQRRQRIPKASTLARFGFAYNDAMALHGDMRTIHAARSPIDLGIVRLRLHSSNRLVTLKCHRGPWRSRL